jgi:hypothetical protein
MTPKEQFKEQCAEILRKNITFSGQIGDYVIHGALDALWELHQMETDQKKIAECYQPLFDYLNIEQGLILTKSELDEIIKLSLKVKRNFRDLRKYEQTREEFKR